MVVIEMRMRQWVPMFLLVCAWVGARLGVSATGERQWSWTLAGLAVGGVLVAAVWADERRWMRRMR